MIPFFLFFATAVSTSLLTMYWNGDGAAPPWQQEIGFTGAAILLIAAYISAFSLWAGRWVALLGLIVTCAYVFCDNIGMPPRLLHGWVFLSVLLLAVAVVYVIGTFRVRYPNVLFPPRATVFGKAVVGVFIAAPLMVFCWLAFWHDVVKERMLTVAARWEPVTLPTVTSGRRQVKITALDSSMTLTVASDELYDKLEAAQKKSVDVEIKQTFKHGDMVAWSVESIDGMREYSLLRQDLR